MSVQQFKTVAYGLNQALIAEFPPPIVSNRNPTTNDKAQIGTLWVNSSANATYILTSIVANSATWVNQSGGTGFFTSLVVNPGDITVTQGNINVSVGNITATLGNISTTTGTISSGSSLSAATTITAGTGITSTTGNIIATIGNISATAGNVTSGLLVTGGTGVNATTGNVSATAGNVIVGSVSVDANANALIFDKIRGAGPVISGDDLGNVNFYGFDGTSYILAGAILATAQGTITTNQVGARLEFYTHPQSTTARTQRMIIQSTGQVIINEPDGGFAVDALTVAGGGITVTHGYLTVTQGDITATAGDVYCVSAIIEGDTGLGLTSTLTLTNAVNTTQSTGTLSIKSNTANNGNNTGFLKVYVGTGVAYVPYFSTIAP